MWFQSIVPEKICQGIFLGERLGNRPVDIGAKYYIYTILFILKEISAGTRYIPLWTVPNPKFRFSNQVFFFVDNYTSTALVFPLEKEFNFLYVGRQILFKLSIDKLCSEIINIWGSNLEMPIANWCVLFLSPWIFIWNIFKKFFFIF